MPQSLTSMYLHIVFSTKYRRRLIDDNIKNKLFEFLGGACRNHGCSPIRVGGYYDHVHILCQLSKKVTVVELLASIKRTSSLWMKKQGPQYQQFYWQNGYAAFTVGPRRIDLVATYIENQQAHHQSKDFKKEMRLFFDTYRVSYDERFVWE